MRSWMLIFVAYLVPAAIGLPLLLLWDSLSRRRRRIGTVPCNGLGPLFSSQSSLKANSSRRMRRICLDTVNGGQS